MLYLHVAPSNGVFVGFSHIFLLGNSNFKGLTARRLYISRSALKG
jgi:hypothetical protein